MSETALIIADPNSPRRNAIMQKCAGLTGVTVLGAATLSETYRLAESHLPRRFAVAAEIAELRDFESLSDMILLMDAGLIIYGGSGPVKSAKVTFAINAQADLDKLAAEITAGFVSVRSNSHTPERNPAVAPVPRPRPVVTERQPAASITRPAQAVGVGGTTAKQLITIGASTGGISALETVLQDFPAGCPPTLVVQHIRPGFAQGLIRRLNQSLAPQVLAAQDGDLLQPGVVYIAADSDRHLGVVMRAGLRIRLIDQGPVSGHRPSVDVLFSQAATVADRVETRSALLTGMGADGAEGMCALRRAGAHTIAQDKESSVVWGMPRVAIEMGGASEIMALSRIGRALLKQGPVKAAGSGRA